VKKELAKEGLITVRERGERKTSKWINGRIS